MRKYYLDNIRWAIVVLVVIYHVVYLFNSVGVVSNIKAEGIPQMDVLEYFVYPWFMCCLFLVSGISARYALQKRSAKEFAKERVKKLLIPSIAGIFLFGWIIGFVTSRYTDIFAGQPVPFFLKYIIYCSMGIGPLWFAHELFLASMLLLVVRAVDKNDKLWKLCGKTNVIVILLLFFAVWGSSYILNTPLITVYRNGIYCFMFFLGYYVFSHEHVQDILLKWHLPLLVVAVITGICYVIYFYGDNYTTDACLQHPFTNFYAWIMILAILGCGKAWFDFSNSFTKYMNSRSFLIYILHYPCLVAIAYIIVTYLNLPLILNYVVILTLTLIIVPCVCEVVLRIPIKNRRVK